MGKITYFLKKILGIRSVYRLRLLREAFFSDESEMNLIKNRERFYSQFIQPGELCFDVGANMGNRISPLLNIGAKVLAIEPQQECHEYLRMKFKKRIRIVTDALGETEGEKEFYISNAHTLSSFSPEWINSVRQERFREYNWDKVQKMRMTTLDNLIKQFGLPVFIKIDVEGYELEVLNGLTQPVKIIAFEYTAPEQTGKAIKCLERIQKINPEIECNYSVGESMELTMKTWLSFDDMVSLVKSTDFIETGFGDIYVRGNKCFQ